MSIIEQERIYNEIIDYYNHAQKLIDVVENDNGDLSAQQFEIIEHIVVNLEKSVETLSLNYIQIIKEGYSSELIQKIRISLNEISARIEECRNKILMLYEQ